MKDDEEYLECHWLFVDVNKKDNKDEYMCGKREDSRRYREQPERNDELHQVQYPEHEI